MMRVWCGVRISRISWVSGAFELLMITLDGGADKSSLIRDGTLRPYPRDLLQHPFIKQSEAKNVNMAKWVAAILAL